MCQYKNQVKKSGNDGKDNRQTAVFCSQLSCCL